MEDPKEENQKDDLYEHFSFTVDKGQNPLRIDKFLMHRIENISRNKIQQAAKNNSIYVGDETVKSNYRVKPYDKIQILFTYPPYENLLLPEELPIDIVYEDEAVLVVNKTPNVVVHPGHGNYSKTLLNGLLYHFQKQELSEQYAPNLVHRIDKDTSGLLVVAKTEQAAYHLSSQFFHKKCERIYYALVWGDVKEEEGTIDKNIGRNPKNRLQMTVLSEEGKGKRAITHYKVLERFHYVTLISCKLETGRTHQIRTHLKYIGHPIFNDKRYGGDSILKGTMFNKYKQYVENCFTILPRQALHAKTLGFVHPTTKKEVHFDSELPTDMKNVIEKWRRYTQHNTKSND